MTEKAKLKLIGQEEDYGCTVACLAMLTNRPYWEVRRSFAYDFREQGVSHITVDSWLSERGYAVRRRFHHYSPMKTNHLVWPLPPFADVHLCEVDAGGSRGSHMVLLFRDGTVFDPYGPARRQLTDYPRVYNMAGVYRVAD